ncbi:hypothetical protein BKA64DRAFT_356352 [Cadophora sp. MPI-SDFR-AT-0126]|nr:hypothetical protein BKA64DRAFT_356352 [Leotiomycetes sp. MPI-SDFR-AT-0126]
MYPIKLIVPLIVAFLHQGSCLPAPVVERQISTIQVIQTHVNTANSAVRGDMVSLMSAIAASSAEQSQLISTIKSDLTNVAGHFETAGSSIASSTASTGTILTAPELLALSSTMTTVQSLAGSMLEDYVVAKSELSDDTKTATQTEWAAALSAIKPFSDPLAAYASKVKQEGSTFGGSGLVAVQVASAGMLGAVEALLASVGVGK